MKIHYFQRYHKMEEENALPNCWESMSYEDFLIERRKLMAKKIKAAFDLLKSKAESPFRYMMPVAVRFYREKGVRYDFR